MRVALLADLREPLATEARLPEAIVAYEVAAAFAAWRDESSSELTVDLFARRGSWKGLPLVSVDPDEIGPVRRDALSQFSLQDAAYCQLFLAGLLDGYDVVHSLAPVVTPLQLVAAHRRPIVQTLLVPVSHPAATLLSLVVPQALLRRVRVTAAADALPVIPTSVDLARFRLDESAERDRVIWLGTPARGRAAAEQVATVCRLPLVTLTDDDPVLLLQRARVFLDLSERASPAGSPWGLRALACGAPVAGWSGGELDQLVEVGAAAVASHGDRDGLVTAVGTLATDRDSNQRRRDVVLARNGRRMMVARYRALFRELVEGA
jgi:hypothetical protein